VSGWDLMLPPFVACMVLVAIHAYIGLHILARGVIFADLALAQMAALGSVVAVMVGVAHDSWTAYGFALAFTAAGAILFAVTRTWGRGRVPQEAIIGIVYVVASAAALLAADKAPRGAEAIKEILVGSILWVTWPSIAKLAVVYAIFGLFHILLRRRFLTISFRPTEADQAGWRVPWWDFLFYMSFGIVVAHSVPIAGVLMVFTFLVVPATIAFLFTRELRRLVLISWGSGAVASLLGLWLSYQFDLPTGPMIVCTYGLLLAVAGLLRRAGVGGVGSVAPH
jgi:zinc/manganese transport system permease protein